eukprot:1418231-Prorocentrum_lima.AAC.1
MRYGCAAYFKIGVCCWRVPPLRCSATRVLQEAAAQGKGLGALRHLDVRRLWLQKQILDERVVVKSVSTHACAPQRGDEAASWKALLRVRHGAEQQAP